MPGTRLIFTVRTQRGQHQADEAKSDGPSPQPIEQVPDAAMEAELGVTPTVAKESTAPATAGAGKPRQQMPSAPSDDADEIIVTRSERTAPCFADQALRVNDE